MLDYMRSLFESVSTVQEQLAIRTEKNYSRTIYIDDCGIEATDFDIQPGDERHRMLIDSGFRATREFFESRTEWSQFLAFLRERFGWKE